MNFPSVELADFPAPSIPNLMPSKRIIRASTVWQIQPPRSPIYLPWRVYSMRRNAPRRSMITLLTGRHRFDFIVYLYAVVLYPSYNTRQIFAATRKEDRYQRNYLPDASLDPRVSLYLYMRTGRVWCRLLTHTHAP